MTFDPYGYRVYVEINILLLRKEMGSMGDGIHRSIGRLAPPGTCYVQNLYIQ